MNLLHHKHNRPLSKSVRGYTRHCLCDKGLYGSDLRLQESSLGDM